MKIRLLILSLLSILSFSQNSYSRCVLCSDCTHPQGEGFFCGCFDYFQGEIGWGATHAPKNSTIDIPVMIYTNSYVNLFAIDISYPRSMLTFLCAKKGNLTSEFKTFNTSQNSSGIVKVSGFDGAILSNRLGSLVILSFKVMSNGCDTICIENLYGDIGGYVVCETVTLVEDTSWGKVKSLYH